jgi:hypothetical protein
MTSLNPSSVRSGRHQALWTYLNRTKQTSLFISIQKKEIHLNGLKEIEAVFLA